jgi:hypothetical protein
MPAIDLSILNQRQTPAFYASSLATRPAFGFPGRIFIDTDSPSTGLYRDTGAAWVQIADPGAGTTGTLQQVTTNGNTTTNNVILTAPAKLQIGALYNTLFASGPFLLDLTISGDDAINFLTDNNATNQGGFLQGGGFFTNYNIGIKTNTPGASLDVHGDQNVLEQLNQTVATNNSLLAFQNAGAGLWRIGNFYNAGANDYGVYDVIGAAQPFTIKKTTGQVLIGTSTVGSGKLVVASSSSDNGVQIVGASAPSLRIDNAESGPTKRAGLGISTASNNFIQGSVDRDFCMFNGSTTASPILFGIYETTNVQEAARISAARNFLIGTTTDTGQKLQVNGVSLFSGVITSNGNLGFVNSNSGQAGLVADFTGASPLKVSLSTYTDTLQCYNETAGYSIFNFTPSSKKFVVNPSGGNFLIGTTTDAGQKLQVNGTAYITGNTSIGTSTQTARLTSYILSGSTSNFGDNIIIGVGTDGGAVGTYTQIGIGYNNGSAGNYYPSVIASVVENSSGQNAEGIVFATRSATTGTTRPTERLRIKSTGVINISSIPTSAVGLSSGDIYSNAGILTIVP